MTYRNRKRLALVILLLGLPGYIVVALVVVGMFDRPPMLVELGIYVGLGIAWVLPLRRVFRGLGKPDPDASGGSAAAPDASAPDASAPDASAPDASDPDASDPDASDPGAPAARPGPR